MANPHQVKKAVIPAAGLGTRFLPFTKAVSKELLPILNKPAIQFIVEELVAAGIEEIIFILTPGRETVLNYFLPDERLNEELVAKQKTNLLDSLTQIQQKVRFSKVFQEKPLGLGHAIGCAQNLVGNEPFIVALPDDLVDHAIGLSEQLISAYVKSKQSLVAVEEVALDQVENYGIIAGKKIADRVYQLEHLVEKPKPVDAPSRLAVTGRYLFNPEIFDLIANTQPGKLGEIQITDAMDRLAKQQMMQAYQFEGTRLDVGTPDSWLKANLYFAKIIDN